MFTLLTLGTIVLASLEWGNYRSMVFDVDLFSFGHSADNEAEEIMEEEPAELVDGEAMINGGELVDGEAMINGGEPVDGEAMINGSGM